MGAQLKQYRRRIRSVGSIAKITRAQELIAASRITRAQRRVAASAPYEREITRAVSAVVSRGGVADHPLAAESENPSRAAMLVVTSDRGFCGAYNTNVFKEAEALAGLLRSEGKEPLRYVVGRKGVEHYRFRGQELTGEWAGFTDRPSYDDAKRIADTLIQAFQQPTEEGGVDEIHLVYTQFVSMLNQKPVVRRALPLQIEETTEEPPEGPFPAYEFEPSTERVLDEMLPRYVESRVFHALLQAAASEHAARQRAMKSATDNAEELIEDLTRLANQARQAEITQEISEIVGGANALAEATE